MQTKKKSFMWKIKQRKERKNSNIVKKKKTYKLFPPLSTINHFNFL